jgi:hypothetical protein
MASTRKTSTKRLSRTDAEEGGTVSRTNNRRRSEAKSEHSDAEIANLVVEAREKLQTQVAERIGHLSVEDIITETVRDMKNDMADILSKMMGFNNSWGRWEVDHCNGRHSVVADTVNDQARAAVKNWITENLTKDMVSKLLDKQRTALIKDFNESVQREARSQLYRLTESLGKEIATEIATELSKELRGKNGI